MFICLFPGSRVTTDQRVVGKQEIQEAESAKRAGAPYAHHRYQARETNKKLKQISQWCEPDEHTCLLRALACETGCWLVTHEYAGISLVRIVSVLLRCGFYFRIQRPLSCSPTAAGHFASLGQHGAARRGEFLCALPLARCSRSPALADLTTQAGRIGFIRKLHTGHHIYPMYLFKIDELERKKNASRVQT
jgi:hypothetical protein